MKPPWNGGNLVVPRLMGVLKASVPLFIDVTGKKRVGARTARAFLPFTF